MKRLRWLNNWYIPNVEQFIGTISGIWFIGGFAYFLVALGTRGCTYLTKGEHTACSFGNPTLTPGVATAIVVWIGPFVLVFLMISLILLGGSLWDNRPRKREE